MSQPSDLVSGERRSWVDLDKHDALTMVGVGETGKAGLTCADWPLPVPHWISGMKGPEDVRASDTLVIDSWPRWQYENVTVEWRRNFY